MPDRDSNQKNDHQLIFLFHNLIVEINKPKVTLYFVVAYAIAVNKLGNAAKQNGRLRCYLSLFTVHKGEIYNVTVRRPFLQVERTGCPKR